MTVVSSGTKSPEGLAQVTFSLCPLLSPESLISQPFLPASESLQAVFGWDHGPNEIWKV